MIVSPSMPGDEEVDVAKVARVHLLDPHRRRRPAAGLAEHRLARPPAFSSRAADLGLLRPAAVLVRGQQLACRPAPSA